MAKGHVLGIAAKRFPGRAFGEQSTYLRGLVRIARRLKMRAYVFSPFDVDAGRERVRAWVWTKKGWRRRWQPLPTVIHDRMWGLTPEARERFREAMAELTDGMGIPAFNPDFGTKYDVHRLLAAREELAPHLPETRLLSPEALRELLERHPRLYLKPARGRQGKGILRLARRGEALHLTARVGKQGSRTRPVPSYDAVIAACSRSEADGEYIVQQGLDLVRVGGGTADIRVIVQRDGRGTWRVSAVGCRIGPSGGFVSNLHAGGRAVGLSVLARRTRAAGGSRSLRRRVEALALATAKAMSAAHPTLGEIGLDLGLDRDGRLWILEVNRQPGRALFVRARLRKAWVRSRRRVVEFARYLSREAAAGRREAAGP